MSTNRMKRLVYSLAIVLAWLGFVVEGSFALFSDSAALVGNTITTGTADLLISNSQNSSSTIYDESRPGFSFTLSPGQIEDKFFILKNVSGSDISFDIDALAQVQTPVPDLMVAATIEFFPVDGDGVATGAGVSRTLQQWASPVNLNVTIPNGATQRFQMRTKLNSDYGQQSNSLSYDLYFTGTQHYIP